MAEWIMKEETDMDGVGCYIRKGVLIRCKDCKHYTGRWCTKYSTKQFDINDICKADDDFCSQAKRKEE